MELAGDHVVGGLAGGVGDAGLEVVLAHEGQVGVAGRDGQDPLGVALEDQRREKRVEVEVAHDVCLERIAEVLGRALGAVVLDAWMTG